MSIHQSELQALAFAVHQGINQYAAVHKKITDEGATLKSAIKNMFRRGTPMSELVRDAEVLSELWYRIFIRAQEVSNHCLFDLNDEEQRYLDALLRYIAAAQEAVAALVARQRILADPPVSWQAFQTAASNYDAALNKLVILEDGVNELRPWR